MFLNFSEDDKISDKKNVRVNEQIRALQVRLVGSDGKQMGVVPIKEALKAAEEAQLDLVEIPSNVEPPVCRIMDHGKFLFEQNKLRAAQRKKQKQKQVQIKEIKLRPATEEGDYQVKLRNLIRFLDDGNKAKVTLRFRGREMSHMEIGAHLMQRIQRDLDPYGTVEQMPKLEGRQMVMVIGPKKK